MSCLFRRIASEDQAVVEPSGKTRWSPKEFLFPRSEALYRYNFTGGTVQLEDPPVPEEHQVLFGVRSCDASGLVRLDEIFLSGTRDRLYAARREITTVVSAACAAADPECFCTAVGYSPVGEEGSDVQLVPLDEGWLLRVLTDKGRTSSAMGPTAGGGDGRGRQALRSSRNGLRADRAEPGEPGVVEGLGRGLRAQRVGAARPALSGLQRLRLRVPLLLVLRHEPRGQRVVR